MFQRALLQLVIVLTLVACGRKEETTYSRKKTTLSPDMMETIMARQNLYCPEGNCPEGIGRVFAVNFEDADNSSMCTGFLVARDLVMTNSHCVYAGPITLKKTCDGLYFSFSSEYGVQEQARCSEIIWRDPKQRGDGYFRRGQQDFALVRLDRHLPLEPLTVDREGLQNWSEVYPIVIDHVDAINARVVKLKCQAHQLEAEGFAKLGNCPAISGNSGSPVIDQNGNVVGILFASENPKAKKPNTPLGERKDSTNIAYAFSLAHIVKVLGHWF